MPAPKTAQIRGEVVALVKAGHSTREIEAMLAKARIKVSKTVIAELAKQFRAGALQPTKRAEPERAFAPPVAASADAQAALGQPSGQPEPDATHVADLDMVKLARMARLTDRSLKKAIRFGDIKLMETLLKTRERLAALIARLRPPILPDPTKDPANTSARDELRARLARTVEAARHSDAGLEQLRAHLQRAEEAAAKRQPAIAEGPPMMEGPLTSSGSFVARAPAPAPAEVAP